MISRATAALLFCALLALINPPLAQGQEDDEEPIDDQDIEEDDLTADQLKSLHKLMDADGNGKLALQEVMSYSQKIGKAIASKDVGTILEEIDTDKSGHLSLQEHLADIQNQADGGDEEEMKELKQRLEVEKEKFAAADSNGDQHLNTEELTALFYPETHPGVLSVTIAETMKQKDKDGDGKLTPHEFWEADVAESEDGQLTEEENADFKKLDVDGDGKLDMNEIRGWESGTFHTEEAMKSLFEIADKDNDMHVTAEELANAREEIALSDAQYHLIEWAEHHEL